MKAWIKRHLKYLLLCVEGVLFSTSNTPKSGGLALVRLDAIGDFVLWLDSAKEYRSLYPDQKITLVANAAWADFAKQFSFWDAVLPVHLHLLNLRDPISRWRMLRRVSQCRFQTVIQPTHSRVLLHGDSVIRASGAVERIGSTGDNSNGAAWDVAYGNRLYTRLIPASMKPQPELARNAEFFSHLSGVHFDAAIFPMPVLTALPAHLAIEKPYFVAFPGASWNGRQWPVDKFASAIESIYRLRGWKAVLCGSHTEAALCRAIANSCDAPCVELAGKTSLAELVEVIRGARLLICNETSAVHIAASTATPAVCIVGGGHFGRFMPYPSSLQGPRPMSVIEPMPCYNCNWHCTQSYDPTGPVPCVGKVSVNAVLDAVQTALNPVDSYNI